MAILFITSNRIGDAVLSTGLLAHLLERYPDDGVFVSAGAPCTALFEATPRLTGLHAMTKRKRGGHWLDLWRTVSKRRWRAVADVRRSALPWLIRADRRFPVPAARDDEHRVESLSRTFGMEPLSPKLWTSADHERAADKAIGRRGPFIAIAPTANWIGKTWPASRFANLAERLIGDGGPATGMSVLIVGAESERAIAQPLLDTLGERAIDGIGIGLMESYAAISRSALFVGNDSGLMHLAAASGVPTAGLFGPSDDRHYAPWGPNGLVIRTPESLQDLIGGGDYDYRNPGCLMTGLTVDAAEAAIRERWPALSA